MDTRLSVCLHNNGVNRSIYVVYYKRYYDNNLMPKIEYDHTKVLNEKQYDLVYNYLSVNVGEPSRTGEDVKVWNIQKGLSYESITNFINNIAE